MFSPVRRLLRLIVQLQRCWYYYSEGFYAVGVAIPSDGTVLPLTWEEAEQHSANPLAVIEALSDESGDFSPGVWSLIFECTQ